MDILWKSLIGGVVTGLIVWLSKKGSVLPGILPLFPTFGLIALYIIGTKGDINTSFSVTGEGAYGYTPLQHQLVVWFAVAVVIFLCPKYF